MNDIFVKNEKKIIIYNNNNFLPSKSECLKCSKEVNLNSNFPTTNANNEKFDSVIS
jgi:hypothetical protein